MAVSVRLYYDVLNYWIVNSSNTLTCKQHFTVVVGHGVANLTTWYWAVQSNKFIICSECVKKPMSEEVFRCVT